MNEYDVLITDEAEADLDAIVAFIAHQWPDRVKIDFLAAVSHRLQLLTTMPLMYRASKQEPTVRECTVNRYVTMYYRTNETDQRVEILSFRDNRQDRS